MDSRLYLRTRLTQLGWPPRTRVARLAFFFLALDLLLSLSRKLVVGLKVSSGTSLGGWVSFLSFVTAVLFCWLALRWLREKVLWRLRNRLIVTYVFIGVIPIILLVTLALTAFYLFAGQFATYIVTSELSSELRSVGAANAAIAHELSTRFQRGHSPESLALEGLRKSDKSWTDRQVCVWLDGKLLLNGAPQGHPTPAPPLPGFLKMPFRDIVRDRDGLFLRTVDTVTVAGGRLTVLSSEPLDQHLLEYLSTNLGEVTLYSKGLTLRKVDSTQPGVRVTTENESEASLRIRKSEGEYVLDTGKEPLTPTYTAGTIPAPTRRGDRLVTFATSLFVVNWDNGDTSSPAAISVETRLSMLYNRLFAALGDFAPAIEFLLLFMAIAFALIELIALVIGVGLTRTITRSVAKLYEATQYINRGELSHRIQVKSKDQLATLETSFNSMTASLERLLAEQKEKQRLENELAIAQEVQAQLFPREISQLESLEVHGFCRPARTVSGDYYDFLALNSHKLTLAVGDISGKGISAALLMATIHSAVRAYSLETAPASSVPVAVGAAAGSGMMLASGFPGPDISPSALLSLLNHQLYESTPMEKYATLFLGVYDGKSRTLTYSNGGHLPPIIMSPDGSIHRLQAGGMVVGLFDNLSFEEASIPLKPGDIFLAYSDGVTEPENDFGEFGERRLIELVRENQHLSLDRISDIVSGAVYDWIGANEQPDDITLVLARAR
jgi:sigma-B regulation protein RsbU (phosphoserine phosphatase)